MILHARGSTKKSNTYNIRFFLLKSLHCKEIFLSENFLLKMATVKLTMVTSSVKGFHVYRGSPDIGEIVKCTGETNRHSNTAIKVVGDANETIGHVPNGLSKVVTPSLNKKSCFQLRLKWPDIPVMQLKEWTFRGGIKACIYRFCCPKKSKAEFRSKLWN